MICARCGTLRCRCPVVDAVAEALRPSRYPLPPRLEEHRRREAERLVERMEEAGLTVERRAVS